MGNQRERAVDGGGVISWCPGGDGVGQLMSQLAGVLVIWTVIFGIAFAFFKIQNAVTNHSDAITSLQRVRQQIILGPLSAETPQLPTTQLDPIQGLPGRFNVDGAVVSALVGDGDGPREIARATLIDVIDILAPIDLHTVRV